jgi:hypothetical protein
LFEDIVCTGEQPWWHLDAEPSDGLRVDDELELGRPDYGMETAMARVQKPPRAILNSS